MREDPILGEVARRMARKVGCRHLAEVLSVQWNPRLRTTAGLANYRNRTITLNPRLVVVDPQEIQRTLFHELAHLVAQERSGRRRIDPHGDEWRKACRDLGIPGESRCHNLPFKRIRMTRKYFYRCRFCGQGLSRVRKLRRKSACIHCCRKYNEGKYDERFRFIEVLSSPHEAPLFP